MRDFHSYDVYNESMDLCASVYRLSTQLPNSERFELRRQLRRAAVSVPSNIAEGAGRSSPKDFAHFLEMAIGSVNEIETQVELASRLSFVPRPDELFSRLFRVRRQLVGLVHTLRKEAG